MRARTDVGTACTAVPVLGWPVLSEGSNTAWSPATVRSLQYLLDAHGARLTVDGAFGPRTRAAVLAFQRRHAISTSDVVRAGTWKALIGHLEDGRPLAVDGLLGPKTLAWVLSFQQAVRTLVPGVTVDGVVGQQTWAALVSLGERPRPGRVNGAAGLA
jgi:peptidoglycan hydrolase-like protein with peptidoglycan-binding domain